MDDMYLMCKYIHQRMCTYLTKKCIALLLFHASLPYGFVKLSVFFNYDIKQCEKNVCTNSFVNY
jgi:hypothetical protein